MSEKACRNCHRLTTTNLCPVCKSTNISEDWTGIAVIVDPENSEIAKTLKAKEPGRYALRVR